MAARWPGRSSRRFGPNDTGAPVSQPVSWGSQLRHSARGRHVTFDVRSVLGEPNEQRVEGRLLLVGGREEAEVELRRHAAPHRRGGVTVPILARKMRLHIAVAA